MRHDDDESQPRREQGVQTGPWDRSFRCDSQSVSMTSRLSVQSAHAFLNLMIFITNPYALPPHTKVPAYFKAVTRDSLISLELGALQPVKSERVESTEFH